MVSQDVSVPEQAGPVASAGAVTEAQVVARGEPVPAASGGPAPAVAAAGFVLLMAFLGYLGWDGNPALPDLTRTAGGLVAALLGTVINPGPGLPRWAWTGLAVVALLAAVSAGVALLTHPEHPNTVVALISTVGAFAGLFVDASRISHTGPADPTSGPTR